LEESEKISNPSGSIKVNEKKQDAIKNIENMLVYSPAPEESPLTKQTKYDDEYKEITELFDSLSI